MVIALSYRCIEPCRDCNNVLIASKVFISDTNHGCYKGPNTSDLKVPPRDRELVSVAVWVGENAGILAGSEIGDGCVIGANSVVSRIIPETQLSLA